MPPDRRSFLALLLAGSTLPLARAAGEWLPTPRQTAGPFYPRTLPLDADNDLVQIAGRNGVAAGEHTNVYGRVLGVGGQPIDGAKVEIWQCDANGRYHHPDDGNDAELDENFQGYGSTLSDAEGRYRFRTIKPVPYPGRTAHIHFRITTAAEQQLTTQLYVRGESGNPGDGIFRRLGEQAERVLADFVPNDDDSAVLMARFDIVIA